MVGDAPGLAGAGLGLEPVDQVDRVVEPDPGPGAHAGAADGDRQMGLPGAGAGAGAAHQHGVALAGEEATGRELLDQPLVDRRGGEVEAGDLLG
jgi:hypothetical protein